MDEMEPKHENRMGSGKGKKDTGPGKEKVYKKPTKPKTFKFEGARNVTLPGIGVVIPGATFTVQPHMERLMVFCNANENYSEVK